MMTTLERGTNHVVRLHVKQKGRDHRHCLLATDAADGGLLLQKQVQLLQRRSAETVTTSSQHVTHQERQRSRTSIIVSSHTTEASTTSTASRVVWQQHAQRAPALPARTSTSAAASQIETASRFHPGTKRASWRHTGRELGHGIALRHAMGRWRRTLVAELLDPRRPTCLAPRRCADARGFCGNNGATSTVMVVNQ
jgi:hypothetical protein